MRTYLKLVITALVATAALAALVSSASARNLSISNQQIRVAWSSLEFVAESTGTTVRCGVTLEGSFHSRTIAKVERSLIGYITRAEVRRPCTGGTAWAYNGTEVDETRAERPVFASSLPWHLTYERFAGTLPNIERLTTLLTGARFRIRATIFGIPVNCDYTTSSTENARGTATRNVTTGVIDNVAYSGSIRSSSGGACPTLSFGSRSEDGIITLLGATTKLTLTLI
jgi:hypothetical protein